MTATTQRFVSRLGAVGGPGADPNDYGVVVERSPRRVRVVFNGEVVADSSRVELLHESRHLPVYYFPIEDVRQDLLEPTEHETSCPFKGDARYWSVRVGDRRAENAVWNYPEPIDGCPDISGLVAFYWDKMDAWFEEDDEVFVHARDPYHRVDVVHSSRHVRIEIDGVVLAESARARLLFETNLPTRYYVPVLDVRMDLLRKSDTQTSCPYKGTAAHWSADVAGTDHLDVAWGYPTTIPECTKIAGLVCFFNEKVDIYVDGDLETRPESPWS